MCWEDVLIGRATHSAPISAQKTVAGWYEIVPPSLIRYSLVVTISGDNPFAWCWAGKVPTLVPAPSTVDTVKEVKANIVLDGDIVRQGLYVIMFAGTLTWQGLETFIEEKPK